MFRLLQQQNNRCVTENIEYLSVKLFAFYRLYQFYIFYDAVQLQYVGTKSYESHKILADIFIALTSLKWFHNIEGGNSH